jgi:starch phosphorylase
MTDNQRADMPLQLTSLPPLDASRFAEEVNFHLRYTLGQTPLQCTAYDLFRACATPLRQRLMDGLTDTELRYRAKRARRVYYLSAEYLIGRSLCDTLLNMGLLDAAREGARQLGLDFDAVVEGEPDAALGNGGLGRLAACYLESMATLGLPGFGYGINYEFGLFRQAIVDGAQAERPDLWNAQKNPWAVERANEAVFVPVYGRIEPGRDRRGDYNPVWLDWKVIIGVPHDIPVVGDGGKTVNWLRLFSARASSEFDVQIFNAGDYIRAVEQKISSETVSKVLYPSDTVAQGKELRLVQEYFLVACAIRDIVTRAKDTHGAIAALQDAAAIQMNDTHPSLAVAELMRVLVDEESLPWERAWEVTQQVCAFTNHTLLPEALERWPVPLFERVLPRHLQLIYEINQRFLDGVRVRYPGDERRLSRVSLIEEGPERHVRMANLAIIGSHSVNGVAEIHSSLIRTSLVPEFAEMFPERFNNKTNGVTPRRWLLHANPELRTMVSARIGSGWMRDLHALSELEVFADDPDTRRDVLAMKRANKARLASLIERDLRIAVDPLSLFDVQVKRMHEYKRQLLNVMHLVHLYLRAVEDGVLPETPRTVIFAGKSAPGYFMAKLIIRLIHGVAAAINAEPRLNGLLKVAFLPDYRVTLAERIIPAADLSEQISTAGTEASGTGNMKLAMNGALTIGTLDGANIEIAQEVGEENLYVFGLRVAQVEDLRRRGYDCWSYYHGDRDVRRVVDAIGSDRFCDGHPGLFRPIHDSLLHGGDRYLHLADLRSYVETQARAARDFRDTGTWARKMILTIARMGKFSSDRAVSEYARDIWGVVPVAPQA